MLSHVVDPLYCQPTWKPSGCSEGHRLRALPSSIYVSAMYIPGSGHPVLCYSCDLLAKYRTVSPAAGPSELAPRSPGPTTSDYVRVSFLHTISLAGSNAIGIPFVSPSENIIPQL
jgi:hypothetical protein